MRDTAKSVIDSLLRPGSNKSRISCRFPRVQLIVILIQVVHADI